MANWEYEATSVELPLTPGVEIEQVDTVGAYVDAAITHLDGKVWELLSHSIIQMGDKVGLSLIFRRTVD